jgi:hypothetical protein
MLIFLHVKLDLCITDQPDIGYLDFIINHSYFIAILLSNTKSH